MPPNGPPPLPRRTDRPRVIRSVEQAVAIHQALCSLGRAVHQLKQTGLSHLEIEEAFRAEMADTWDEATQ